MSQGHPRIVSAGIRLQCSTPTGVRVIAFDARNLRAQRIRRVSYGRLSYAQVIIVKKVTRRTYTTSYQLTARLKGRRMRGQMQVGRQYDFDSPEQKLQLLNTCTDNARFRARKR